MNPPLMHRLPSTRLHLDDLVATLHEGGELVDGEVVFHAVAQLLGHLAGVVSERLHRFLGPPAPVPVLQRLGQVPVVQRPERLDARRQQLVDQAAVEVDALQVGWPVPSGKTRGQETENR